MSGTAVPGPVGRLGVICRAFPDNTLGAAATDLLALLPAVAATGTRVSVVCESPMGRSEDLIWRGVDLHRLHLPPCGPLPAYAGAARWAQAAAEWLAVHAGAAGVSVVEAPEAGAEGLHVARAEGVALVTRVAALPTVRTWWDAADPAVLALMEDEARRAAVLRVGALPTPGPVEMFPLIRLSVARRPVTDGPVVVAVPADGRGIGALVRALAAVARDRAIALLGCRPGDAAVAALPELLADGIPVVASTDPSVAAATAWLEDAAVLVVPDGADTALVVDALAHGVPVVTDAPIDLGAPPSPGLFTVAAQDVAAAVGEATGAACAAAALAGAPAVRVRFSPRAAALRLIDRYAVLPGRRPARRRRSWGQAAGPRFARDGGRVAVVLDGTAPHLAATVARLRLTAGSDVSVTVVGGAGPCDAPFGDVHHLPGPAADETVLAKAAAGRGARWVLALRGEAQFDPGWAARLDAAVAPFGPVGVVGPTGTGFRVRREGGALVLTRLGPGVSPCDVVLSPVLCLEPGLASGEVPLEPLEAALRRALRARAAGTRVLQVDDVGVRPVAGCAQPDRVVVPVDLESRLAAEGLVPDGWIVELRPDGGFHPSESPDGTPFAWMTDAGVLRGDVPVAGRWELSMSCRSFHEPRELRAEIGGGVLALGTVPPDRTVEVRTALDLQSGPLRVDLHVSVPARRPRDVVDSPDDRPLSVSVSAALLERVG